MRGWKGAGVGGGVGKRGLEKYRENYGPWLQKVKENDYMITMP